jgi:hypothetical protein
LTERISKLIKGINILVDLHRQIVQDYQDTQAAQAARETCEKYIKRRVIRRKLITIKEARYKMTERARKDANSETSRAEKRRRKAIVE